MKYIKLFESISEKLYHGNRKGDFPPEKKRFAGAIFLTSNLEFAKDFSGFYERKEFPDGAVWEVELKENVNLCDPMEIKTMVDLDLKGVIQKMIDDKYVDEASGTKFDEIVGSGFKGYNPDIDKEFDIKYRSESVYFYLWRIKNGAWRIIECNPIIWKIKQSGFDGFYVTERGSKNVAVFDEKSIKSFEKMPEFSGFDPTEIKEGDSPLVLDWKKNIKNAGNMRHIQLFESFGDASDLPRKPISNQTRLRNSIADKYMLMGDVTNPEGEIIGDYMGVKVRVINRDLVKMSMPEWWTYIGSHHWGKKTDYIPEDEIWIVQKRDFDLHRVKRLLNHEIIEREMMRALEEDLDMDPQTAWEQAHYYLKQMGF